jgi:hypothetical protein
MTEHSRVPEDAPPATLRTRSEAVEHLTRRGFHAKERDWGLGATVVVATDGSVAGNITVYARAMYIVPKGDVWTSFELDRPRPDDDVPMSLAEACARVERILTTPLGEHSA